MRVTGYHKGLCKAVVIRLGMLVESGGTFQASSTKKPHGMDMVIIQSSMLNMEGLGFRIYRVYSNCKNLDKSSA